MIKFYKKMLLFIVLSACISMVFGLPEDRDRPIEVSANKMLWQQKNNTLQYMDNVEIKQGHLSLKADSVYIDKQSKVGKSIGKFIAKGVKRQATFRDLPRLEEGEIKAWADEIIYDADSQKVTLKGNAKIIRDGDQLSAPMFFYYVDTRDIEATNQDNNSTESRVNIIISPETLESNKK